MYRYPRHNIILFGLKKHMHYWNRSCEWVAEWGAWCHVTLISVPIRQDTGEPPLLLPYFLPCTAQQPGLKCWTRNYVTCSKSMWCYLKYWILHLAVIQWRSFLDSLQCEFLSSYHSPLILPQSLKNYLWRIKQITSSTVTVHWDIKKGTRRNEIQGQNIRQIIKI
jgi:hypothetical protein